MGKRYWAACFAMFFFFSATASGLEENSDYQYENLLERVQRLEDRLAVKGFGTFGASRILSKYEYYDVNDRISLEPDSIVGIQLDIPISSGTTAVTQMVGKGSDGFDVDLEWAFLKYEFRPDLHVRIGRLRYPAYMLSEYLQVGYAYPWVKPPIEVYEMIPITGYEGMDLLYYKTWKDFELRVQPYWGASYLGDSEADYPNYTRGKLGVDLTLSKDVWTFRLGYSRYKLTFEGFEAVPNAILDGARVVATSAVDGIKTGLQFSNPAAYAQVVSVDPATYVGGKISDYPGIDQERASFMGLGLTYDDGQFMVMAEYTRGKVGGWLTDSDSYYLLFGYRFGKLMPYLSYAKTWGIDDELRKYVRALSTPSDIYFEEAALSVAETFIDHAFGREQQTKQIGVRWDFKPGMACKFSWEEISGFNGTAGMFYILDGGFFTEDKVNVWRLAIDVSY